MDSNFFTTMRRSIAQAISPDTRNKFNEAFLFNTGAGFTNYSTENQTYIDKGYNINPIVYSVINQQAVKTASIPFQIKKIKDKESFRKLSGLRLATKSDMSVQQRVKDILLQTKAFEDEDIRLPLEAPNASQSWNEFFALYKTFLKLTGNVYIYMLSPLDGPNKGRPIQVYILPSHLIQIIVKAKADLLGVDSPVKGYILTYGRQYLQFEAENVIHIKYSNPNYDESGSHLYGMSPLQSALRNIQSSNVGLDLNIKTLKSGGAFGFIHGKSQAINETQAKEIKSRLLEMNTSPDDLSKIAGISAEIGFTRLSLTSDELKPFDYLKFDQKQICNVLGWSDKLLNNDDSSKFDNINQERKRVITDNIQPDLKILEQALNRFFLPRFKGYENSVIEFDVTELPEMQTDIGEMVKWLNLALDRGVITRNEYRVAISYIKSDDALMDVFTVQNDVIPLAEAMDNTFNADSKI